MSGFDSIVSSNFVTFKFSSSPVAWTLPSDAPTEAVFGPSWSATEWRTAPMDPTRRPSTVQASWNLYVPMETAGRADGNGIPVR